MAVTPWELEMSVAKTPPATPFTVVTLSANKGMFNLPLINGEKKCGFLIHALCSVGNSTWNSLQGGCAYLSRRYTNGSVVTLSSLVNMIVQQ